MNYYPAERLGEHQSLTKEGFLLCTDVPLARTGMMLYGPGEVPVDPAPGEGVIYIHRDPEEVFNSETMASLIGKPVVIQHPDDDITPRDWKDKAVGTVIATRRGISPNDDLMIGDLMVTADNGIKAIREEGLREVSCGYDAKYEDMTIPGHAKQKRILYNHLALVDSARCGPRCTIGDKQTVRTGDCNMTWLERVRAAFKAKDEAALDAALAEAPKELTDAEIEKIAVKVRDARSRDKEHGDDCDCAMCKKQKTTDSRIKKVEDAVDGMSKDVKSMKDAFEKKEKEEEEEERKAKDNKEIEGELEEEAPPGSGDKARKARDSAFLVESFQETVAMAEIITPGVQIPTYDSAAAPKQTYLNLCKFRKQVLEVAHTKPEYKLFIDNVLKGKTMDSVTCDSLRTIFRSVGEFAKNFNNTRREGDDKRTTTDSKPKRMTLADVNKMNREFYAPTAAK